MTTLADHRRALVTAKEALRKAKEELETTKTIATMHTNGTNDRERKKADDQALLDSTDYQRAKAHLINCENLIDEIETEIDILKDERTARELSIREENNRVLDKYADALLRMMRANPVHTAIDANLPF